MFGSTKIIARIKGGLGNQLFCYAAARRLALANNVELVLDDVTGFTRDLQYNRRFALDHFHIPARRATSGERLEPFERLRRAVMKLSSRRKAFAERRYLEQEGLDFDERLLSLKVKKTLYLDGLWQGEFYFKDVEQTIREDLRIVPPTDPLNQRLSEKIRSCNSVSLHVRWFDAPDSEENHNVSLDYYRRAVALIEERIASPQYFLFSDDPEAALSKFNLSKNRMTVVAHNHGDENAYADLWLMSQCRHYVTANSTFSWWGAWLGGEADKIVITPDMEISGKTAWGFNGLIPANWTIL